LAGLGHAGAQWGDFRFWILNFGLGPARIGEGWFSPQRNRGTEEGDGDGNGNGNGNGCQDFQDGLGRKGFSPDHPANPDCLGSSP
jgi:hypothetical protein